MKKYDSTVQNTFPAISQNINQTIVKTMFSDYNKGMSPSDLIEKHSNVMDYVDNVDKETRRRISNHAKNRDYERRNRAGPTQPVYEDVHLEGNQAKLKKLSSEKRQELIEEKKHKLRLAEYDRGFEKGEYKDFNYKPKTSAIIDNITANSTSPEQLRHTIKRVQQAKEASDNRAERISLAIEKNLGMSVERDKEDTRRVSQDKIANGKFQPQIQQDNGRWSDKLYNGKPEDYKFSNHANEVSNKPFVGPIKPDTGLSLEKILNRIKEGPLGDIYRNILNDMKENMPYNAADATAAVFNGVDVEKSKISKLGKVFGGSEYHGINKLDGQSMNINYMSTMDEKEIDHWKRMHREETSKSVRQKGGNIDPFFHKENDIKAKDVAKAKESLESLNKVDTTGFTEDQLKGHNHDIWDKNRIVSGYKDSKEFRSDLKARNFNQIVDIDKRLDEVGRNPIKNFFSKTDMEKSEIAGLKEARKELVERNRRLDGNYDTSSVHQSEIEMPKGARQLHPELEDSKFKYEKKLKKLQDEKKMFTPGGVSDTVFTPNKTPYLAAKQGNFTKGFKIPERGVNFENMFKSKLEDIKFEYKSTTPDEYKRGAIAATGALGGKPLHTKDSWKPVYGTSGYGLGFKNSLMASRREHASRALHYMNPFGAGGASSMQAIRESFGFMHANQRLQAKQAVGFAKIPHLLVPSIALGVTLSSMSDGDSASDIFTNLFSMGTSMHGWRVGTALGASVTRKASLGRVLATGVGGITGLATGLATGVVVAGALGDLTSQDSIARKTAKKISTKELYNTSMDSHQSLTARQASLQKLAKSGLNDRGLLLGNEAAVLKGAI